MHVERRQKKFGSKHSEGFRNYSFIEKRNTQEKKGAMGR